MTAVYLFIILAFFVVFQWAWPCCAGRWLGITAVTAAWCLWVVWRYLPENMRMGETVILPTFGWGNGLTLLRGLCISLVAGFLLSPWPDGWLGWLPAILYTLADAADYLDGYAARITHHVTRLGERLDMEFDGLGMMVVSLLAVWYGQLPWWYLLIGLARYFFVAGLWLRHRFNLPVYPMVHSWHRRIFAGFQMGFMSVVLWPIVPTAAATIAGTMFALATTASFLRDWLVVIGWVEPNSEVYIRRQRWIYRVTAVLFPPFLRFILLICVIFVYINLDLAKWVALFTAWHLPWPEVVAIFWALVGMVAAGMVVAGAMGRVMALVLTLPLGFAMLADGVNGWNGTAVACAVAIMLSGTGAFSLWQPEERFMYRRAGER